MNKDIRIRADNKAEIKWTFTAGKYRGVNEYFWNKIVFTLQDEDIKVEFIASKKANNKTGYIRNYRNKTANDTLIKYGDKLGRHFTDGLLTVYHDLNLPLGFTTSVLREV